MASAIPSQVPPDFQNGLARGAQLALQTPPYPDPTDSSRPFGWEPDFEKVPILAPFGYGAWEPRTVFDMVEESVRIAPENVYMKWKAGHEAPVQETTYRQFFQQTLACAKSMVKLGLEPFHGVSIMGFNSPEWIIANFAAMYCGGFSAGIYTTNGPDACQWVADNSRSQIIVVEKAEYLDRVLQVKDKLPHAKAFVQWRGELKVQGDNIYDWKTFMELGKSVPDEELAARREAIRPGHCCCLIYTSGTTGNPKGVMLSHDNVTWQSRALVEWARIGREPIFVGFLPLSHIAAQLLDMFLPIYLQGTVFFAQPDALKGTLTKTLIEARPTVFFGVPRVWEKVMEGMKAAGAQNSGVKKSLVAWAKETGLAGQTSLMQDRPVEVAVAQDDVPFLYFLADALVFSAVRKKLGLDRCQLFATGAAPLANEAQEFFLSLALPLCETYGASETTGVTNFSILPGRGALGTCGPPIPGCEVKINGHPEGEILSRSRNTFMGYLFNEKATRETILPNGFYRSGDVGKYDERGFLLITGRTKELLITAGGENIAPVLIENNIKAELGSIVANVMAIGDKKKFISALICLKTVINKDTAEPLDDLEPGAAAVLEQVAGKPLKTVAEARDNQKVTAFINEGIARANKKAINRASQVRGFRICPKDFSLPGGELTPTMKLKRRVVYEKYEGIINEIYAE